MFSIRIVLGDKASEVEQVPNIPEGRPPAHWTGRGRVNEGIMFGDLSILLLLFVRFLLGVCMGV